MQKPKVEKINLPYASTVASFYGDQGGTQGNSFLGKFFGAEGGRKTVINKSASPTPTPIVGGNVFPTFARGASK